MTTAPDLDRPFYASELPPLPSSSGSRHRRLLLSIPSNLSPLKQQQQQHFDCGFDRSHDMLSHPDSMLSHSASMLGNSHSALGSPNPPLDRHESMSFGRQDAEHLTTAYLPRRSVLGVPSNVADESQGPLHGSILLPGKLMSHSRTASAPSMPSESGDHISWLLLYW